MGALPYQGGVTFRVWAPFAEAVAVAGDFNQWSSVASPLAPEGASGYWSADVPGALVGQQYKFVVTGADPAWRIDPYARSVTNSIGNTIITDTGFDWGGASFAMPTWNELVIYELHIGTFNDVTPGLPGNFDNAIARLPHLQALGVNMIEVMPVMEFPGDFSWGYNPAHIFAVESAYGGPAKFKEFIKAAHALGLGVVLDVVYNHLGPNDLSVWQFDGWSENGLGGIYFFQDWRHPTPWGDRPDYGRPEVCSYVRDNVFTLLDEFRLDGLRFDAVGYIRNVNGSDGAYGAIAEGWNLLQSLNGEVRARSPWKITIAEDLQGSASITTDTDQGGAGFGSQWDAGFVHPVRGAIIPPDDASRDMNAVASAIYHRYGTNAFTRVIYTESHDEAANGHERVPEEIWPGNAGSYFSRKRSTLGAALVFTAPGIPMILQGQEFLENKWFADDLPVEWTRADTFSGIVQLYQDLIHLRRNWFDNSRGLRGQNVNVFHVNQQDKVIAFHRWEAGGPGDDVVVVINFSNASYDSYDIGFPRAGVWWLRLNSDWNGYGADFGNFGSFDTTAQGDAKDGLPTQGSVGIGPYTMLIYSQ